MEFIDIIILLLALWAVFKGWRAGFVKEIVSMIGFFAGLFVAASLYANFGEYLAPRIGTAPALTDVIAFVILWVVVPIVLGMVANILTKALKGMKLGLPNSLLGAAVSVLKYLVLMGCIFNVMSATGMINPEKAEKSILFEPVKSSLVAIFGYINTHKAADVDAANSADDVASDDYNAASDMTDADADGATPGGE